MSIILDEVEFARQAIETRELGRKPLLTLRRVAQYYLLEHTKKETRDFLDVFLLQCRPTANRTLWGEKLDSIVRQASQRKLSQILEVCVTQKELETIEALWDGRFRKGYQLRRLAFTLLCVAKYRDAVNPDNNHWVSTKDSELLAMANVTVSTKRQCLLFAALRDAGMIRFAKKVENLNVQVLFMNEGGEIAMHIADFRNLGNQYMRQIGQPYFECACCGLTVRRKSNAQKYCKECAGRAHAQR